jgi:hypothetical protein
MTIWISFVHCQVEGRGDFRRLCERIWAHGYKIAVPTPIGKMPMILKHMGFERHDEISDGEMCEVWCKG